MNELLEMPLSEAVKTLVMDVMTPYHTVFFVQRLADGRLARADFLRFFAYVYGVVTSFNQMLTRTLATCDVVTERKVMTELRRHLREEMKHNDLYRLFLEDLVIDHDLLHQTLLSDFRQINYQRCCRYTAHLIIKGVEAEYVVEDNQVFPQATFPNTVISLIHYMEERVGKRDTSLTEMLAALLTIELMVCHATTHCYAAIWQSAPPGGNIEWFKEHRLRPEGEAPSMEQLHLTSGIARLNERPDALNEDLRRLTLRMVSELSQLYWYVLTQHDQFGRQFPIERFIRK